MSLSAATLIEEPRCRSALLVHRCRVEGDGWVKARCGGVTVSFSSVVTSYEERYHVVVAMIIAPPLAKPHGRGGQLSMRQPHGTSPRSQSRARERKSDRDTATTSLHNGASGRSSLQYTMRSSD